MRISAKEYCYGVCAGSKIVAIFSMTSATFNRKKPNETSRPNMITIKKSDETLLK